MRPVHGLSFYTTRLPLHWVDSVRRKGGFGFSIAVLLTAVMAVLLTAVMMGTTGAQGGGGGGGGGSGTGPSGRGLPVMFVHGLDPGTFHNESRMDYSEWNGMFSALSSWGWDSGSFEKWGYYECDLGFTRQVDFFGDHDAASGGPSSHRGDNCEPSDTHDRDTPIQHLAHHWAWGVYDTFGSQGSCVNVVAHSMGGLIARYALSELGGPEFPPSLCVANVVTFGTPHAGSVMASYCRQMHRGGGQYSAPHQCQQMEPDSGFIAYLRDFAQNPQGTGGTQWILVGSEADAVVTEASATSMPSAAMQVIYGDASNVYHSDPCNYMFADCPSYYMSPHAADDRTANAYWLDADAIYRSTTAGAWPVRWADLTMAGESVEPTVTLSSSSPSPSCGPGSCTSSTPSSTSPSGSPGNGGGGGGGSPAPATSGSSPSPTCGYSGGPACPTGGTAAPPAAPPNAPPPAPVPGLSIPSTGWGEVSATEWRLDWTIVAKGTAQSHAFYGRAGPGDFPGQGNNAATTSFQTSGTQSVSTIITGLEPGSEYEWGVWAETIPSGETALEFGSPFRTPIGSPPLPTTAPPNADVSGPLSESNPAPTRGDVALVPGPSVVALLLGGLIIALARRDRA